MFIILTFIYLFFRIIKKRIDSDSDSDSSVSSTPTVDITQKSILPPAPVVDDEVPIPPLKRKNATLSWPAFAGTCADSTNKAQKSHHPDDFVPQKTEGKEI